MRGWLDSDGNWIHLRIVGSDKNLNVALVTTAETWNAYTYTVQAGDEYLAFYLVVSDQPVNDFKIMVSLEDAAYEPYQSNTFILDSGQTIYGGTVNWQSGVASIDRLMITLEGTEGWTRVNGSYPYYALNLGELNSFSSDAMLCSHFRHETIAASKAGENVCDVIHSSAYSKDRIAIRPIIESVTNLDTFKEYLAAQHAAGTPVQVLYSLAAPTTIQLTPQEITTLAGRNTLSCDIGTLEVSGRTDVMGALENVLKRLTALEEQIAELESRLENYYEKSEVYTKAKVDDLINAIPTLKKVMVNDVGDVMMLAEENTIYFVPKADYAPYDEFDEYIIVNGQPELLGSNSTDI